MKTKFFNTEETIHQFLGEYTTLKTSEYEIVNIDNQLVVNTFTDVEFTNGFDLSEYEGIPVKFGIVQGNFDCSSQYNLKSVDGMPYLITKDLLLNGIEFTKFPNYKIIVHGNVDCSECYQLKTLKNFPETTNSVNFYACRELISLKYLPQNIRELHFEDCALLSNKDLKYIPPTVEVVSLPFVMTKIPELPLLKWFMFESETNVKLPTTEFMRQLIKNNTVFEQPRFDWVNIPDFLKILILFKNQKTFEGAILFEKIYNEPYILENNKFTIENSDNDLCM